MALYRYGHGSSRVVAIRASLIHGPHGRFRSGGRTARFGPLGDMRESATGTKTSQQHADGGTPGEIRVWWRGASRHRGHETDSQTPLRTTNGSLINMAVRLVTPVGR